MRKNESANGSSIPTAKRESDVSAPIEEILKKHGHTWKSFQALQQFLRKCNQLHYTRKEVGELHTTLEQFRNTKGLSLLKRRVEKKLFRQKISPEEQILKNIDSEKGDRSYLNHFLLKYACQADEIFYQSLIEPQLKSLKKVSSSKQKNSFYLSIPLETDLVILIANPLLSFAMLNEVISYQNDIFNKTRKWYITIFINRWLFKFNRFALSHQKTLGMSLYNIFFSHSASSEGWEHLHNFITQVAAGHLAANNQNLSKESRNNIRTIYLIFLNLMLFLLQHQKKIPSELYKIFAQIDNLTFFSRKDYLIDGMRADYEKFHPLPDLSRKTESSQQQKALQSLMKKRFLLFWKQYSQLSSYDAKINLCSSFTEQERVFIFEQFYHYGQILELAKLHEHLETSLNRPEGTAFHHSLNITSLGNKLLRTLWKVAQKYKLHAATGFSEEPSIIQYVHQRFSNKSSIQIEKEEFHASAEDRKKNQKKDWRLLTIHEIPFYTKIRRWSQIERLSFDIPDTENILFSLMPYVRMNPDRLEERITMAHCLELCRLPFRYLVTNMESRFKFHFITIGDLLLMQITGLMEQSSHSLFRFVGESKQVLEPKMIELLTKTYSPIEKHFGETLRANIPYVINHRYSYKGGGVNGINAGVAIERINELEDKKAIYLSSGKMFFRIAEEVLLYLLYRIEPNFVEDDSDIGRQQIEPYLDLNSIPVLLETCIQRSKADYSPFSKWWQTLADKEKQKWYTTLIQEVLLQHQMFFHEYPNPYILPTY